MYIHLWKHIYLYTYMYIYTCIYIFIHNWWCANAAHTSGKRGSRRYSTRNRRWAIDREWRAENTSLLPCNKAKASGRWVPHMNVYMYVCIYIYIYTCMITSMYRPAVMSSEHLYVSSPSRWGTRTRGFCRYMDVYIYVIICIYRPGVTSHEHLYVSSPSRWGKRATTFRIYVLFISTYTDREWRVENIRLFFEQTLAMRLQKETLCLWSLSAKQPLNKGTLGICAENTCIYLIRSFFARDEIRSRPRGSLMSMFFFPPSKHLPYLQPSCVVRVFVRVALWEFLWELYWIINVSVFFLL